VGANDQETQIAGDASLAGHSRPAARSMVIACEMIEDEVLLALGRASEQGVTFPLAWMPAGRHERPDTMRTHIQGLLDLIDAGNESGAGAVIPSIEPGSGDPDARATEVAVPCVDQILLAIGYCGSGIMDLVSQTAELAFPRVDDCVSLFLNTGCTREEIERDARAFYLTRGWLCHDFNPFVDSYRAWVERYGVEKADRVRKVTLTGYERITLVDTGAYDLAETRPDSEALAFELQLDHTVVAGSTGLLERLFLGPWNSEIVRVPPGQPISIFHLFGRG
jgi:Protein of unknown function (DUF1638)